MKKRWYSFEEMRGDVEKIASFLRNKRVNKIYGIPRGGLIPAVMLSHLLEIPLVLHKEEIDEETVVIDDIVDTGNTISKLPKKGILVSLFYKAHSKVVPDFYARKVENDEWVVFPFETEASSRYDGTEV